MNDDGKVIVSKPVFTYEIDFLRNSITANITRCTTCEKHCKHYRKLCVVEDIQGYSNSGYIDNLRALAILYSIHDGNFTSLQGVKPQEDVEYQLNRLKSLYETNCNFVREEKEFQKMIKSKSKKKRRNSKS